MQPFSIGGSLLRETFDTSQPAAWGLPSDWVTYFNGDRAFNVSGNAKVVGAYPGTGNMLASGYEVGAEQLRGKADVVSMDVGPGLGHGRRLAVDVPLVAALAVAAGLQHRLPRAVEGGHGAGAEGRRGRRVGEGEPGRRGARDAGDAADARDPADDLGAGRQGRRRRRRRGDAPAGAVAKSTAAKVTVTCKLAKSKRAVTCTVRGAKGTKLRADAGARQGQGPSLRHGTVTRDTPR